MRKICGMIMVLCLLLVTQMTGYATPPAVEGFMGVPWGANRQQVEAVMVRHGYAKIPRPDFCSDPTYARNSVCSPDLAIYDGSYADERAELQYLFLNNAFYAGQAEMAAINGPKLTAYQAAIFPKIKELLIAKYGQPDEEFQKPAERQSTYSAIIGAQARALWRLNAGEAGGDEVELSIYKQEGTGGNWGMLPGYVKVYYNNRSLEQKLKNSNL